MNYEFDPEKLAANVRKHLMWFEEAIDFEWETAIIEADNRKTYGETRFEGIGYIGQRLCVMIFCLRMNTVRIISLRKANFREVQHYAQT